MFDYFNSTRRANQILARIAKTAFNSAETKPIVECHENLASGKIVLKLRKLDSSMWKVCAPVAKKIESSCKKVITSDDIFNPSAQMSKKKLAKKRKLESKNLQVEEGIAKSDRNPCKKRRVLVKKIKKRDASVICTSKNSIRRSKRLATKAEKIQNIKDKAVADLYCSTIVSQPSKRKKSAEDNKPRRIQKLRPRSNDPS